MADAVVDASVWVSRLLTLDIHHARSRSWLDRRMTEGALLIAPALMPPEVAGAVARRTGEAALATRAVEEILRLPALRVVSLDENLAELAASLAARLALRGADAVYVAVAHQLGLPLVTWDREQRERAAALIDVGPASPA